MFAWTVRCLRRNATTPVKTLTQLIGGHLDELADPPKIGFHGCNPVGGRMRRRLVSPLPTLFQRVLHLLCESAPADYYSRLYLDREGAMRIPGIA